MICAYSFNTIRFVRKKTALCLVLSYQLEIPNEKNTVKLKTEIFIYSIKIAPFFAALPRKSANFSIISHILYETESAYESFCKYFSVIYRMWLLLLF